MRISLFCLNRGSEMSSLISYIFFFFQLFLFLRKVKDFKGIKSLINSNNSVKVDLKFLVNFQINLVKFYYFFPKHYDIFLVPIFLARLTIMKFTQIITNVKKL